MDLCMIIAMYAQDINAGLLYTVGYSTALTTGNNGDFENIDTLSRITLQNKGGEEILVKGVMNGSDEFHAFLFENGTVRVIKYDESFDIALRPEIIKMNSGNNCNSLFIVDAEMRAYEIKDDKPVRVTGIPDGIKIKDISCGVLFTVFLSKRGQVFGMGSNGDGRLGLPRRIKKTKIPTEITFPSQSDSDKTGIIVTMTHTGEFGWVAVDYKQRMWVVGEQLMQLVCSDPYSLDPCIGIIEVWYLNDIRIAQIGCGFNHVIALSTEGRVYWFGRFGYCDALSRVSPDPISFSHRIIEIRSGFTSVACKDTTNEWHIWGYNSFNHITGLCGCEAVCKKTKNNSIIYNPMKCKWQGLFDVAHVFNLQPRYYKAHVIVNSV